ncbi:MAG: endonuclease domain-containing protein [Ignavibacteriales bacterium]|nr:endonuclease domain-containing protein [Ignavibacteriales bacterium]MBK8947269.1 endonuclease domain-containing protein [Ignavibacteriota bacterium]
MTKHYNKPQLKEIRRKLRRDQTFAEQNMWAQLRNRKFLGLKFKRQYSIDNFIIDFYCPVYKIAIELDGDIHELQDVKLHDEVRQKYLESFGVKFIRITNDDYLGNPNKTFDRLESEINFLIKGKS